MMITHRDQAEKRPPVAIGEIDTTPSLLALFERNEMTASAANVLIGLARARTLGYAARLGRRHLLALPGVGHRTLAELERIAAAHGIEVAP